MINDLIYVYCLLRNPIDLQSKLKSNGFETLMFDDFTVIAKYVNESEFSEENLKINLSDIQWIESNAREHFSVISLIMENSTVIPFRFGTIFNTHDSLKKFITDYSDSLIENFLHIAGKEEWSVKIYCNRNILCEQIDELSQDAAEMEKQIMASSPGKAFLLKRKKTDLIENEMNKICQNYGQQYYNDFKSLSELTYLNNLLPKEFTGREDTMILNASFLVIKNKVTDFIKTSDTLRTKDSNIGFSIEVTGPWPPFSFISIKERT